MYASMIEPLNRSLETFITKLSKSTERRERSRRTLKKPKSYKDESDDCIDTWIEVMKLHFEEESLSKKQECSALTSNLEGTDKQPRRTLKKPKSYKDESDDCIDTWIEVMKLHFEEESLSKKQECSALTSNLNCVAKFRLLNFRHHTSRNHTKTSQTIASILG